jgi:DNA-binding response OmpR family regulator
MCEGSKALHRLVFATVQGSRGENVVGRGPILVVDDHPDLCALVSAVLSRAGHRVVCAADGRAALRAFFELRPALVVLDLDLPEADGWLVLERIRELSDVPVLMLTGASGELEKVRAFRLGADDYVTKPFSGPELTGRVGALLRRARPADDPITAVLDDGLVHIDFTRRAVRVGGRDVRLTPLEFRLLSTLARHRGQVLSREQLMQLVWDDHDGVSSGDEVRVYIGYLRRKLLTVLPGQPIETVRGFGYRYEPAAVPALVAA